MFDLNLADMLYNSASDKTHIWFAKNQENKEASISSYPAEDPDLAYSAYTNGKASLYLSSSLEFRNKYCKALSY
jgi:hypothetical protein